MVDPRANTTTELIGRRYVEASMTLRDPHRPSRPLPRLIARLLPEVYSSRFSHDDLPDMNRAGRDWEAHRIRVACALVDDNSRLPAWLLERLQRLAS